MAQQRVNLTDSGKDAIMKLDSNCYDLSTRKFDSTNLIHNLTTTDGNKPLAADQGPAIQALLDTKADKATVTSGMTFKGTCTYATLPTTNNTNGDFWYCTDTETNYGWTNTAWVALGDLNYSNVETLDEDFEELQANFDALEIKADIDKKDSKSVADGRKISDSFDMTEQVSIYDGGNAQASGVKIYGETIETGTGTKSPSNPYTTKSLGEYENKVIVRTCKENLLANMITTQTTNGVTLTVNNDGTILANGTATADIYIKIAPDLKLKSGQYFLSGCTNGSSTTYYIYGYIYTSDTNNEYVLNLTGDTEFTVDETRIKEFFCIGIKNGTTLNNVMFKPMLRFATMTDGSYKPYIGSNITLPINNGTITNGLTAPLRRLSDTVYDWIDWDNGKVHRKVGKVVLDGSNDESYGYGSSWPNPSFYTSQAYSETLNIYDGESFSNILPLHSTLSATSGTIGYAIEGVTTNRSGFFIKPNETINTVVDFRTWLSSNNLEIYYKLKTETIEDIDVTLLDQRLYTYEDLTNVIEETSIKGKLGITYVGRNNNYANDIVNDKKYLFYLQMDGSQPQLVTREV